MFGIGGTELIVIGIVLLVAVGPNKLPNLKRYPIPDAFIFEHCAVTPAE